MPKYSKQFKKLFPTFAAISYYIESRVGGTVFPSESQDLNGVNFRWKKTNANTMEVKRYNYMVTYLDLESIVDPMAIAQSIVEKIEKGIENGS